MTTRSGARDRERYHKRLLRDARAFYEPIRLRPAQLKRRKSGPPLCREESERPSGVARAAPL